MMPTQQEHPSIMGKRGRRYLAGAGLALLGAYVVLWAERVGAGDRFYFRTDFVNFFTAGHIIRQGLGPKLYDLELQASVQQGLIYPWVMPGGLLDYRHPPFYALPFALLAELPLVWAYWLWVGLSLTLLAATLFVLISEVKGLGAEERLALGLVAAAFFPLLQALLHGQNSVLALFLWAMSVFCFRRGWEPAAGGVLALALFKPQLVLPMAGIWLVKRRWGAAIGFGAMGGLLAALSLWAVGTPGVLEYGRLMAEVGGRNLALGEDPAFHHSWNGFWHLLLGPAQHTTTALLSQTFSLITLGSLLWVWRREWRPKEPLFDLQIAFTVVTSMLAGVYLLTHDLTLLLLPGFLALRYGAQLGWPAGEKRVLGWLLLVGYAVNMTAVSLARLTGVQWSTVYMALFTVVLARKVMAGTWPRRGR